MSLLVLLVSVLRYFHALCEVVGSGCGSEFILLLCVVELYAGFDALFRSEDWKLAQEFDNFLIIYSKFSY